MKKWTTLILIFAASVYGADWYTWRGPDANGISSETGFSGFEDSAAWSVDLGVGYSSVSVKDGRLYTMGHLEGTDTVFCLDALTGKEIWRHSYPCKTGKYKGPRATPTVDGEGIYTVSREGNVICFEASSGKVLWQTDVLEKTGIENIRWGIATSAVIEGGRVLLNIGEAGIALNKNTGKIEWESGGAHSYATPVVFESKGKRLAAFFSAPGLMITDVNKGKVVADYTWETKHKINGADPLILDDQIFISSGYGRGCAMLDFSSGKKLKKIWENEILKTQFSSAIYLDGYIYGIDGNERKRGYLRCIDAEDGVEMWNTQCGFGSLISADGKLIVLGDRGTLWLVNATHKKYDELASVESGLSRLCWTPPVLANGILYCRNDKGTLKAIKMK